MASAPRAEADELQGGGVKREPGCGPPGADANELSGFCQSSTIYYSSSAASG